MNVVETVKVRNKKVQLVFLKLLLLINRMILKIQKLLENEEAMRNIAKLLGTHDLESDIEFEDHEIVVEGVSLTLNGRINVKT